MKLNTGVLLSLDVFFFVMYLTGLEYRDLVRHENHQKAFCKIAGINLHPHKIHVPDEKDLVRNKEPLDMWKVTCYD